MESPAVGRTVSAHAAGFDHRAYLFFAVLTHAAVGYAVVSVCTDVRGVVGVVGGVLPDVDLLFAPAWQFPFVHRGVTHTLLFVAVAAGGASAVTARCLGSSLGGDVGRATALALCSHLVVDSLTASGVRWLYPLSPAAVAFDVSVHSFGPTLVLWSLLLSALFLDRRRSRRAHRSTDRTDSE